MASPSPHKFLIEEVTTITQARQCVGKEGIFLYVRNTKTLYKWDDSSYITDNGTSVLSTAFGNDAGRFHGIAGEFNYYGGGSPVGGTGAVQFNNGGVFGGDNTKLLWTSVPDRLSILKRDGGGIMPATIVDGNCILSLMSTGNATNFWFAVPALGASNATFGFNVGGGANFKHAMTYMVGADKLVLTPYGAMGTPSDGLYVDAAANVSVGDIATIPAKLYVGGITQITTGGGSMKMGNVDAFSRTMIWHYGTNSVLKLGSLAQDGDPSDISSEGIVCVGPNSNGAFAPNDWAFTRVKSTRLGINNCISNVQTYIFRADELGFYTKNDTGAKTFEHIRATGRTKISGDTFINAGINYSVQTINISTLLDATYHIVLCNSATPITVTLPAAASNTGREYTIININTGVVTIDGNLAETINGAGSYDIVAQYTGTSPSCNGSAWFTQDYDPSRLYSTSETNTGKIWVDGKSIYRRAFTGTTDNDNDTLLWTDASDTIDDLIDCNATLKKSSAGGRWSSAGNQDDAYISMYCQEPSGDLRLFHTNAGAQGVPYLAWIEYTKV